MSVGPFIWTFWRLGWAWAKYDAIGGWRPLIGRLWWCVDPDMDKLKGP